MYIVSLTRNIFLRVLQVVEKGVRTPNDTTLLVGGGVGESSGLSRLATEKTVEVWALLVRASLLHIDLFFRCKFLGRTKDITVAEEQREKTSGKGGGVRRVPCVRSRRSASRSFPSFFSPSLFKKKGGISISTVPSRQCGTASIWS